MKKIEIKVNNKKEMLDEITRKCKDCEYVDDNCSGFIKSHNFRNVLFCKDKNIRIEG